MEQTLKVLLIEDSPLVVELTRAMLVEARNATFSLECSGDLASGLRRLSRDGVDVVLLDLTLPDSNGLTTFARLHAESEVPTVIYTSIDDEALSLQALEQGASDYLVKSEVNATWLARSLVYAVQRGRVSQSAAESDKSKESGVERTLSVEQVPSTNSTWLATLRERKLISVETLDHFRNRLLTLLSRKDCTELRVDLTAVDYLGNAAISTLLVLDKRCRSVGKRLVLCGMSPQVREQFASRRFDKVFEIAK